MTKTESRAMCLAVIFEVLKRANAKGEWETNEFQRKFLEQYQKGSIADLPGLEKYIEACVTTESHILNDWFNEHDFPGMQVNIPPKSIGIGTIFDLLVRWKVVGTKELILINKKLFQGVGMKPSSAMKAWTLEGYKYPMFEIDTRDDGWKVFLVESEGQYSNLEIPGKAAELLALQRAKYEIDELHFPSVSMEMDVDVSFLIGMKMQDLRLDQVIKKVKLRLDKEGAHARAAMAAVFSLGASETPKKIYIIENPFFVIFWREGLNFPPFVAIADKECWEPAG